MGEKGAKPDLTGGDLRIAVVVSRFNEDVTKRLLRGALGALEEHGVQEPDVFWVPGSLELPVTALALAERGNHDAIVCLGCVIRGETYHFEIVAGQSAAGIMQVQLDTGVPVAFGFMTMHSQPEAASTGKASVRSQWIRQQAQRRPGRGTVLPDVALSGQGEQGRQHALVERPHRRRRLHGHELDAQVAQPPPMTLAFA